MKLKIFPYLQKTNRNITLIITGILSPIISVFITLEVLMTVEKNSKFRSELQALFAMNTYIYSTAISYFVAEYSWSFFFSAIGIVFDILSAKKASRLNLIKPLGHE
ncbi:hypothetical protein JFV29_16065 [Peribacillus sp. TH16]|uniref:hypothetical protein n=2 Tax=Peribacillus TaxID=2675229 RepID=UPI001911EFF1|nr:hypothetical protein [Peribacillus sp. TH16]MBK5483362.1 hypothetical protein [Peribacillus sp. TH16]